MNFEFILKGKLAENGLNVRKLAAMLDMSPENLHQKLKRGSISYDNAQKIAELLGYKIEWIKSKD